VEDDFHDFSKTPVLNGLLQADSTLKVQLSFSTNLNASEPEYIDNAFITIFDNHGKTDTLKITQKGWYTSDLIVKAGFSYTCIAEIPGFSSVKATTTVPLPTAIGNILFTDLAARGEEGEKISSFEFIIEINPSYQQFWHLQLVSAGLISVYNPKTQNYSKKYIERDQYILMDVGQDSVMLGEANPLTVFSNTHIKGNSYKVKFFVNSKYMNLADTSYSKPVIILKSVDKSYYHYLKQNYIYETAGYIDIGMLQQFYPLYSNINNGLGVFTGLSLSRKEINISELKN
jgi:hypothetical protein